MRHGGPDQGAGGRGGDGLPARGLPAAARQAAEQLCHGHPPWPGPARAARRHGQGPEDPGADDARPKSSASPRWGSARTAATPPGGCSARPCWWRSGWSTWPSSGAPSGSRAPTPTTGWRPSAGGGHHGSTSETGLILKHQAHREVALVVQAGGSTVSGRFFRTRPAGQDRSLDVWYPVGPCATHDGPTTDRSLTGERRAEPCHQSRMEGRHRQHSPCHGLFLPLREELPLLLDGQREMATTTPGFLRSAVLTANIGAVAKKRAATRPEQICRPFRVKTVFGNQNY